MIIAATPAQGKSFFRGLLPPIFGLVSFTGAMGDMGDSPDTSPVSVSPMNLDGEQRSAESTSGYSSDSSSTSSSSDSDTDSNECWKAVSDESVYTAPAESATTWTAQKKDRYCCYDYDVLNMSLHINISPQCL